MLGNSITKVTAVITGKAQLARFRRGCADFVFNAILWKLSFYGCKPQHVVVAGRAIKLAILKAVWN